MSDMTRDEYDKLTESVAEAVAAELGDAYDCIRCWSAWFVGTMTQNDFMIVADDAERTHDIARAALAAAGITQPAPETPST